MGLNWLKVLRSFIEMDFEHQKANARHYKIVLTLITLVSYIIARTYQNIMICVNSLFIGTILCFFLFGLAMPWSKKDLEFKLVTNNNNLQEEDRIAPATQLSMVAEQSFTN